ncbi:UNVERIFIED_CONTAM: Eukaryotic translation initiation factor 3 subunit E [Sesamum radiatum]|uniref:Eukaryotic translation initiation factor 3 subunit E n=1 Tax=Sesamum radiatum TaxID=300843 RepID=A0AAW2TJR4_SESRA
MAAKYDLTQRIAPQLDRHLVFPLLEFLQERGLYPEEDILKAKIELLNDTNMVDLQWTFTNPCTALTTSHRVCNYVCVEKRQLKFTF